MKLLYPLFQPMLSAKCPPNMSFDEYLSKIRFPVLATPKIDGIRGLTLATQEGNRAVTRKLKPIPNLHVRHQLEINCPPYLDGELTCGHDFQAVTSGIMTHSGQPLFTYYVFDCRTPDSSKSYREMLDELLCLCLPDFCSKLFPTLCENLDELFTYENECLNKGAEGVMIRSLSGIYKFGRSTINEQYLMAIKRFEDEEGVIFDFVEQYSNENPAETDALGYTERSSSMENLRPADTLGALWVRTKEGIEFKVGTGFTARLRKQIWMNKGHFLGKTITFKYQKHGVKIKPRIPSFKGFRED